MTRALSLYGLGHLPLLTQAHSVLEHTPVKGRKPESLTNPWSGMFCGWLRRLDWGAAVRFSAFMVGFMSAAPLRYFCVDRARLQPRVKVETPVTNKPANFYKRNAVTTASTPDFERVRASADVLGRLFSREKFGIRHDPPCGFVVLPRNCRGHGGSNMTVLKTGVTVG